MKSRGRAERDGGLPSRRIAALPREPKGAAGDWTEERGACDERRWKEPAEGRPEASGKLQHDGAAVHDPAEGLDGGRVVFAGRVQPQTLHGGRGLARVERAAHQVVEG